MEMHGPKRGKDVGEHGCVYKSLRDLARAWSSIQEAHDIFLWSLGPDHHNTKKAARALEQLQVAPFGGPAEAPNRGHGPSPINKIVLISFSEVWQVP
jgi:hypothetical protein